MKVSEAKIKNDILLRFGARADLRMWNNPTGAVKVGDRYIKYGLVGSADILGILKGGRFLAIEVKTATGRQSEPQKAFQRMIERFGGVYILARSAEDVERELRKHGNS